MRCRRIGQSERPNRLKDKNETPLASIIINNRNYGRFLVDSMESALAQSYPNVEVVVVDDGSGDCSSRIIASYGCRVRSVFQEHGGQASAVNSGVEISRGDLLFFLDADDVYHPDKIEHMVALHLQVAADGPCMISHRLRNFGHGADRTDCAPDFFWHITRGRRRHDSFDLLSTPALAHPYMRKNTHVPYLAAPTSGISLSRSLADRIFPLPEAHRVGADCLLARAAVLMGNVFATGRVHAMRRIHDRNNSASTHEHLEDETFLRQMDCYLNRLLQNFENDPAPAFT